MVVGSDLLDVVTVPVGAAGVKGSFDGAMRPEVFFRGSVIVPYKIKDQLYSVPRTNGKIHYVCSVIDHKCNRSQMR